MGLIIKQLIIKGIQGQVKAEVLFDTGVRRSVIRKDIARKVTPLVNLPSPMAFRLAESKTELKTNLVTNIILRVNGRIIQDQFYVLEKLSREVIIGADTMQSWEIKLDPKNESIKVGVDAHRIELLLLVSGTVPPRSLSRKERGPRREHFVYPVRARVQ
ncbi:MAG: retroviral-like aspartic protease [Planctomycetes bacterium]|nr:retroviral-like aspartic protease [Planctomycetota bacterium]